MSAPTYGTPEDWHRERPAERARRLAAPAGDGPRTDTAERRIASEVLCGCGAMHLTKTPRDRLIIVLHSLTDEDFDWSDAEEFADALLPVVASLAREQAAEELGEALGIATTRGPLEAVAWMARRHAALRAGGGA